MAENFENYSFNPFLNEHDENSFLSINAEFLTINTVKDKLETL